MCTVRSVSDAAVTHPSLDAIIARLAARQHGVFTRSQAQKAGATRGQIHRRILSGLWLQHSRDTLLLAGAPKTREQTLLASCMTWGPAAVVSHRAAASMWLLEGLHLDHPELTVPRGKRHREHGSVVIHRNQLERIDVTRIGCIPVTTPARTLIDLAAVVHRDLLEEALDDALRRRLVTIARVERRLEVIRGQGGRRGVRVIGALLDERKGIAVPESRFETRLFRLIRRAGLPLPVPQYVVRDDAGRFVARPDFVYPAARLAIEAESRLHHELERDVARDQHRRNALMLIGWRILHVRWEELVEHPERIVEQVRAALGSR